MKRFLEPDTTAWLSLGALLLVVVPAMFMLAQPTLQFAITLPILAALALGVWAEALRATFGPASGKATIGMIIVAAAGFAFAVALWNFAGRCSEPERTIALISGAAIALFAFVALQFQCARWVGDDWPESLGYLPMYDGWATGPAALLAGWWAPPVLPAVPAPDPAAPPERIES